MQLNGLEANRIPRIFYDTNFLISALVSDGKISCQYRSLWSRHLTLPLICPETEKELKTDFPVAGDRHLLTLANSFPELHIVSPSQFLSQFSI